MAGIGSLKKDKNYRRYASSVERALSLFDNALQEWADYISFLSRLLKVSSFEALAISCRIAKTPWLGTSNAPTRPTRRSSQSVSVKATRPMLESIVAVRRAPKGTRSLHLHIWIDKGTGGQLKYSQCVY